MTFFTTYLYRVATSLVLTAISLNCLAQPISEGFDNISTLSTGGWALTNNSSPTGTTGWFQGNASVFNSQSGSNNAYIAADQNNATGSGTISNWLISPNRTFKNGDVITFYTRTRALTLKPDRLQVRMSTNGTSTNVGTTASSVGDFSDLLLEINASQVLLIYPGSWTQYSITISGLTTPTSGRIAFRYYLTNGGSTGSNGDYIGIDEFEYTPYTCPTITLSPSSLSDGTPGLSYSTTFSQSAISGATTYTISAGSLPPGLSLSSAGALTGTPTTLGTYTFTVRASHTATQCIGTKSYTLIISCPAISISPATLPDGSTGNVYSRTITQTGGTAPVNFTISSGSLPSGLSLSASGVLSGTPTSSGSYSFTIKATSTVTGCTGTKAYIIDVDCGTGLAALSAFSPACANSGSVTLTGGTPAGGSYSGTGVTGGSFDPKAGTQAITYTYTDASGCSSSATATLTVNDTPNINFAPLPTICRSESPFTLNNATPAGGNYSGTGVSNNQFSPIVGTQTISYTYTDNNGCTSTEVFVIVVDDGPPASFDELPATMCKNSYSLTLTGGTPAGGQYVGNSVKNGIFTPDNVGVNAITYIYPDPGNGCDATFTQYIDVVQCPLDIDDLSMENQVLVYPNPSNGLFIIETNNTSSITTFVTVSDLKGRIILRKSIRSKTENFDLTYYPKGIYLLTIIFENDVVVQKMVIE